MFISYQSYIPEQSISGVSYKERDCHQCTNQSWETEHKRCLTIKGVLPCEYEAPIPHPILISSGKTRCSTLSKCRLSILQNPNRVTPVLHHFKPIFSGH